MRTIDCRDGGDSGALRALALLALVGSFGCGASVHSTVTRGADLGHYHVYRFAPPQSESPSERQVRAALKSELARKGLVEAPPGGASDFTVAYRLGERDRLEIDRTDYGFWVIGSDIYTYTEGTIRVDFIDPRTTQIFWSGTASDILNSPSSPRRANIDAAVGKVIRRYPVYASSSK